MAAELPAVWEPARSTPVFDTVDVLVIGGGPSGVAAAVGAAKTGAKTILVERHGFLGGMWTAGMVLTLAGYNSWLRPYRRCVAGVAGEWLSLAVELNGAEDNRGFVVNSDPEVMKLVADRMLARHGVQTLFHTFGAHPIMVDGRVGGAFVENVTGRFAILAGVTIDASGDGDVIARSGASWVKGNTLQPMTMPFRLSRAAGGGELGWDEPACIPIGPEPTILREPLLGTASSRRSDIQVDREEMRRARARGELPLFGGPWFGGLEPDVLWVNATRIAGDASDIRELSRAEARGREESFALAGYLRRACPELANSVLLQTSPQIGVRETRRMVGACTLAGDDLRTGRRWDDAIAVGCWPIDEHRVEDAPGMHAMYVPAPFGIPMGSLVPESMEGLVAAGRCISVDREALASTRVGATCAAVGHAAGVLAALAVDQSAEVREVSAADVRAALLNQGAIVDPESALT